MWITDETDFSEDGGKVVLNAFINKMKIGDIVFSCYSASTIDAIGIVTGEYEWHEEYEVFRRVRKVHWLVKNIRENILAINGGTSMTLASVYRLSKIAMADVFEIVNKYEPIAGGYETYKDNFVFIIDEINRGNISKIFGELITLIEESKRVGRTEGMKAVLPYSGKLFGVPENVYIIGTMNDIDRSVESMDFAFRRRFSWIEVKASDTVDMLDPKHDENGELIISSVKYDCFYPYYYKATTDSLYVYWNVNMQLPTPDPVACSYYFKGNNTLVIDGFNAIFQDIGSVADKIKKKERVVLTRTSSLR